MNKTKIDWCDMSWNPVTGCLHECEYCYARQIANRFGVQPFGSALLEPAQYKIVEGHPVLDTPLYSESIIRGEKKKEPYPFRFEPTFHRYRLGEPTRKTKPQTIFVCSMADLFGEWVPDAWIQEVFDTCMATPQHRYLFLTKNPVRYDELIDKGILPECDNMWYGSTCTDLETPLHWNRKANTFMSCEPMLAAWPASNDGSNLANMLPDWVILGAESGNRKGRVVPERRWVENAVAQCRANGQPVFMKESLRALMGEDFVQEFPWKMTP